MFNLLSPNKPIDPKKSPIFYGWVIVVVGIVGIFMTIPGQTTGVSVFTDYIIDASHLTRLQLSNTYLFGTLLSALFLPMVGNIIDRLGSRIIALISCVGLSLSLVFLSYNNDISNYLKSLFIDTDFNNNNDYLFLVSFTLLIIGFFGIRFFGQGALMMSCRIMLSKWFDKKRGMVAGLQGIFVAFFFSIAPFLLNLLIGNDAWQQALISMALFIGLFGTVFCWVFFRDNPERCGLTMDNLTSNTSNNNSNKKNNLKENSEKNIKGITRRKAIGTLAFWVITSALSLHALLVTAITFHIVNIGASANIPREKTLFIFVPIAFFSVTVGYIVGLIADRTKIKGLFVFMMLGLALGTWSLTHLDSKIFQILSIIGIGASSGCFGPLNTVAYPYYFGRRYLGAILGIQTMFMVAGSAVGPSLFAFLYDLNQSYSLAFHLSAILPLAIAILAIFIRQKKFQES